MSAMLIELRRTVVLTPILVAASYSFSWGADVTSCSQICSSSAFSCAISATYSVAPGAVLDCHDKNLTIDGRLTVTNGSFELKAKTLTVSSAGVIESTASSEVPTGYSLNIADALTVLGKLVAPNGGPGSSLSIAAGGNIQLGGTPDPVIGAEGSATAADGAVVDIIAGGGVTLTKSIQIGGKLGGTDANANVGGRLTISSGADIWLNASIVAYGRYFGGGFVSVEAARDLLASGRIEVDGRAPDADGGEVQLAAGRKAVLGNVLFAEGASNYGGGQAAGGAATVQAGCGGIVVQTYAMIDVNGGEENGGDISLVSDGDITIPGQLLANSTKNGGSGGTVRIAAGKTSAFGASALVQANGHASATSGPRAGGLVEVSGCRVAVLDTLSAGARIESTGRPGGMIKLAGNRSPLQQADASDYSIRVGNLAHVTASGVNGGANGSTTLSLKSSRTGWCQGSPTLACQLDSQCTVAGSSFGPCVGLNPDLEQSTGQFAPQPSILLVPTLPDCSSRCS